MKYLLVLLFLCSVLSGSAQEKGLSPLSSGESSKERSTWAVVVGISDYQDEDIPDLRFADRDALAFANFLRSPAGGSLDGDHLKVLLNSEATMGQFAAALDWLWDMSKDGDLAIIYFSGHGDVEKKSLTQPGFLLCWDAPSRIYMGGGAFALPMLQEVISTISVQNKSKVVVITDACRSGKLAGSAVGGAQITGANLARQYANEIKILSCRPEEYSIEGEQWGGGRGAFSYNLVNALYGMADANQDLSVSLKELARYLEDHVSEEVAPISQNPQVIGSPAEQLAYVDAGILADLRAGRTNQMRLLSPIESRGLEDAILANVDSSIQICYWRFQKALEEKNFFSIHDARPGTDHELNDFTAEACYAILMAEPGLAQIHATITRNYAAALQDDAQGTLNKFLKRTSQDAQLRPLDDSRLMDRVFTEKVRSYPACLARAAELLGEHHYMYPTLKAREYYFKGYIKANTSHNPNRELGEHALALFRESLKWEKDQPQVYLQMGNVFGWNLRQADSMVYYAERALELYPDWIPPFVDLALYFSSDHIRAFDRAKYYLEQATRIDSTSVTLWSTWGAYYFYQKDFTGAEASLKRAIQLDPQDYTLYGCMGMVYTMARRAGEAEDNLLHAIQLDSTDASPYGTLGMLYSRMNRFEDAERYLKKAILIDSTDANHLSHLAGVYRFTGRPAEAELWMNRAIQLDPLYAGHQLNLGILMTDQGRFEEGEMYLKKSILLDPGLTMGYSALGFLYLQVGRLDESESLYLQAIQMDPVEWSPYVNLGMMYQSRAQWAKSEDMIRRAIERSAPFGLLFALHGHALSHLPGRLQDARLALDRAIELEPDLADTYVYLAYWELTNQNPEPAWSYLREGLEKGVRQSETIGNLLNGPDFEVMRQDPRWSPLIRQYFPEQTGK